MTCFRGAKYGLPKTDGTKMGNFIGEKNEMVDGRWWMVKCEMVNF